MVQKELEDGAYHASAYFVARMILLLPFEVFPPIVFCCIVYWMAALYASASAFVLFTLVLILTCLVATSVGCLIGALCRTVKQAIWVSSIVMLLNIMVVHFLVLDPPAWISWTQYLAFSTYSYAVSHSLLWYTTFHQCKKGFLLQVELPSHVNV